MINTSGNGFGTDQTTVGPLTANFGEQTRVNGTLGNKVGLPFRLLLRKEARQAVVVGNRMWKE
jgi:hypothetical protein